MIWYLKKIKENKKKENKENIMKEEKMKDLNKIILELLNMKQVRNKIVSMLTNKWKILVMKVIHRM